MRESLSVINLGRGTWNRTTIYGFGDRYTSRCTMPLYVIEIIPREKGKINQLARLACNLL